ncbi:MAG: hypothetical protein KAU20_07630 [Nanoarchaeota archaeon]|nr:hypothetical protein [Nanoarchaeota archaeon]
MAIETKDREIEGHKYMVTQFPARIGLGLKTRLSKLVIPVLIPLIGSEGKGVTLSNITETDIDPSLISKAVEIIISQLDSVEIVDLVMKLMNGVRRDGVEITAEVFDTEFAGEYITLYKVLFFVIQTNNFFGKGGIGQLVSQAKNLTESTPSKE